MPDITQRIRGSTVKPARVLVPALAAAALLPGVSSHAALGAGIAVALTLGNPWPTATRQLGQRSLMLAVIGLGASMDLGVVARVGLQGVGSTAAGIALALAIGTFLGRRLRVERDISWLISVGTAICGGSAIAAVGPALRARERDVSMALATVFLLNAAALILFPMIGHHLQLAPEAFGLWCALAIHDTSSVVAAAAGYEPRALEVATAAKLARALWIVPVTFGVAWFVDRDGARRGARASRPWFVVGFLAAAAVTTFIPVLRTPGHLISLAAQRVLVSTLFLVGLGLSRDTLRKVGPRPLLQGLLLWIALSSVALTAIVRGWIV